MPYRPCKICNEQGSILGEDCTECNGTGLAYVENETYEHLEHEDFAIDEDDL